MVDERLSDGVRIAQLLASELDGLGGALAPVSVTDADADATPRAGGAFAYAIALAERGDGGGSGERARIGEVYVHPERARLVLFVDEPGDVVGAGSDGHVGDPGIPVRRPDDGPSRLVVPVEDGAAVKRAVAVVERVL